MTLTAKHGLIILSPEGVPAGEPQAVEKALAPRLRSLDGRRIAVVDEGFPGAEQFVNAIGDLLADRYADVTVRRIRKPMLSKPSPISLIEEIAANCDAAIVGVAA